MNRPNLPRVAIAVIVGLTAWAPVAEAGRVAVLAVRGDDSGDFDSLLIDAVGDAHDVVNARAFQRAARREGVGEDPDARDFARVARTLGADAVLDPFLSHRRDEWILKIKIRGTSGKVAKTMKVSLDAPRLGPRGKRKVVRELLDVIDVVIDGNRRADRRRDRDDDFDRRRDRDDDRDRRRFRDERDDRDEVRARARRDRDDDFDDDFDDDRDDFDDDRDRRRRRRPPARQIRRPGILFEAGSSAITRRLSFSSKADFAQAPQGYEGKPVPAGRIGVEMYPVAIALPRHAAGGIGVYGEYERVFSLTTRTSQAPDVPLTTRQLRWVLGARFRYGFGQAANLPTVTVGVGYGRRAFIVDRSPLPSGAILDLPDVDYRVIEPSLGLRVPLGTDRVALAMVGHALLFRSAGPIERPEEYGAATLTGLDFEGILDLAVTRNVLVRLRGQYTRIGYAFTGNGAQTTDRDGDPNSLDVGGALDQWMGGTASLAVLY